MLACLLCGAGVVQATGFAVSGSAEGLWLVRPGEDGESFSIFHRPLGKDWKPVIRRMTGQVEALQAVGDQLHLFFTGGAYQVLSLDGSLKPGINAPGKVLALTARPADTEAGRPAGLLALLFCDEPPAEPLTPMPSTAPATRPARPEMRRPASAPVDSPAGYLCVYRSVVGVWKPLWARPVRLKPSSPQFRLAWRDGRVLLLDTGVTATLGLRADAAGPALLELAPGAVTRLGRWDSNASPLGLLSLPGGLVALAPRENPQQAPAGSVGLAVFRWDSQTRAFQPPPDKEPLLLQRGGQPVWFDATHLPEITQLGEQIALLRTAPELTLLLADATNGTVLSEQDVTDALKSLPDLEAIRRLDLYFNWGVIVLIALATFVLKPQTPPGIFRLPETMKPGRLLKRLAAAAVDYLPFLFISMAAVTPSLPAQPDWPSWEEMNSGQVVPPLVVYIAVLGSLVAYMLYCVAMELWKGATPGKMLLGLRVVGDTGQKPGLREVALRNLLKLIELMMVLQVPLLMIVPLLVPLLTRYRQRLGDWIARTAVIQARLLPPPVPKESPPPDDSVKLESYDDETQDKSETE